MNNQSLVHTVLPPPKPVSDTYIPLPCGATHAYQMAIVWSSIPDYVNGERVEQPDGAQLETCLEAVLLRIRTLQHNNKNEFRALASQHIEKAIQMLCLSWSNQNEAPKDTNTRQSNVVDNANPTTHPNNNATHKHVKRGRT